MTIHLNEQADVSSLAAMINSRLAAEARIARAAAFAWLCAGAAIALILAGLGSALAFLGYSGIVTISPAAELVGHALVNALEHSKLTTTITGTMSLAPSVELKLASNQRVSLNDGATVKLAENSSVRVMGNFHVLQPSSQQLQLDNKGKSSELPFTNYTIFKEVEFGKGYVATGWNYELSDTVRPKSQICSYKEVRVQGLTAQYTIAVNNAPQRPSALANVTFDFDGALKNCIWFSGY